jgi:hypothetical protein
MRAETVDADTLLRAAVTAAKQGGDELHLAREAPQCRFTSRAEMA